MPEPQTPAASVGSTSGRVTVVLATPREVALQ